MLALMLGVVALAVAETAAAEVLLAVFTGSILIVWAVELLDHAGILPGAGHRTGLRVFVIGWTPTARGEWRGVCLMSPLAAALEKRTPMDALHRVILTATLTAWSWL